jgi:hypothetical protein
MVEDVKHGVAFYCWLGGEGFGFRYCVVELCSWKKGCCVLWIFSLCGRVKRCSEYWADATGLFIRGCAWG